MASTLDLSTTTFTFEQVRGIKEAIWTAVYNNPALNEFHTLVPNIKARKQVVILGLLGLSGKKHSGVNCAPEANPNTIPSSEKFWEPEYIEDRFVECFRDLLEKFTVWGLKNGIDKADLTGTDFAIFLEERIGYSMAEAVMRHAWFGDTAAANVASLGVITDGIDVAYFNAIDGFWKQIFAIVAANADQHIAVAKNAGASYAAQKFDAADVTNGTVTTIFQQMIDGADERLTDGTDIAIVATKSMVDQYKRERQKASGIELAYTRVESGISYVEIDGIRVYAFSFWDRTIKAYQDNGTTYNLPHRAVLLAKSNMQIGTEEEGNLAELDPFYDKKDKEYIVDYGFNLDALLVEDYKVMAAY